MKNLMRTFLIAATFLCFAQVRLFAHIAGTAHDFSNNPSVLTSHNNVQYQGMNVVAGPEICHICHVPHNGRSTIVPLWRGGMQSAYRNYTPYSSATLNATVNQPLAPTLGCLSCHDGSIAQNSGETSCNSCHHWAKGGPSTNLSPNHPVSFTYDSALAQKNGTLHDPKSVVVASLGGKTINEGMLYQNRLECTSCHDVHATKGDSATAKHLLLVNNNGDKLCLTCHNK